MTAFVMPGNKHDLDRCTFLAAIAFVGERLNKRGFDYWQLLDMFPKSKNLQHDYELLRDFALFIYLFIYLV